MRLQLQLLGDVRFRGLFWTQFLGAFNDNFFKNSLVLLILFRGLGLGGLSPEQLCVIVPGLFILPFFLFSATAGQLADKYEKSRLIRLLKVWELFISLLGAGGLATGNLPLMLFVLFAFALHSAFFGPIKYGILPQLLDDEQLLRGNALVEMGTSVAVLAGTIVGGLLVSLSPQSVSIGLVLVALGGLAASCTIPAVRAAAPGLEVNWWPVRPTLDCLRLVRRERSTFLSALGISWFWLYAGAFVTLLPAYAKDVLGSGEGVVTLLIALFTLGVSLGALLCDRLSHSRIELGLVPLGSLGMTALAVDLFVVGQPFPLGGDPLAVPDFLARAVSWRVCADLFLMAMCSAFFLVPLFALIQRRTDESCRSRVIAGNNVMNSFFMVASTGLLMLLMQAGLSVPQIFAVLALMNGAVAVYIYGLVPEFCLRFLSYLLAHGVYRLEGRELERIPSEGAALLVCNHISFVDWLILHAIVPRPVRFVMWHTYAETPVLRYLFRDARVIPIASGRTHPEKLRDALDQIARELEQGELVCLFPEGKISQDGELAEFRRGVEEIVARTPVPLIPMALRGMWGSLFSRYPGRAPGRGLRARIEVVCGPAAEASAAGLQLSVARLLQEGSNAPGRRPEGRLALGAP